MPLSRPSSWHRTTAGPPRRPARPAGAGGARRRPSRLLLAGALAILASSLLAACGNSASYDAGATPGGARAGLAVPIRRTYLPFPDGVSGVKTEACVWTRDGAAILCPFVLADGSVAVGTIAPDGSGFQCITCGRDLGGDAGFLYAFADRTRFFFATLPSNGGAGASSGANAIPYVGECSPSLLECDRLTIVPVELPTIEGTLNRREPRIAPDGRHYLWTIVRTDGFILLLGDLARAADAYQVSGVRVLNPAPDPKTAADWAIRGSFTEGKSFNRGGQLIFASTRAGGMGLDDYALDLATGATTRITSNLEWDEDASYDPSGRYLILGSARHMHNDLRTLALGALPAFLDSTFLVSSAPAILGSDALRLHALEKWLTTSEIEMAGGDGEMLNDKQGGWASGASKNPWSPDGTRAVWGERGLGGATRLVVVDFPTLPAQPLACADPASDATCVTPTPTWAPAIGDYPAIAAGTYAIPGPRGGTATLTFSGTVLGNGSQVVLDGFTDERGRVLDGTLSFTGSSFGGTQTIAGDVTFSGASSGGETITVSAAGGGLVCGMVDTVLSGTHLHTNLGQWNPACGFATPVQCPDGADADATDTGDCSADGLPSPFGAPLARGSS